MDYQALKTLIQTNANHATMTDAQLVGWLNDKAITKTYDVLSTKKVWKIILKNRAAAGGYNSLTADQKDILLTTLQLSAADGIETASGSVDRAVLTSLFSGATITDLVNELNYQVSRVANSSVGAVEVSEGQVNYARSL
jgi:hypothetical protein